MSEHLSSLIKMSRKYGSNPDYVLAGGGNTSYKTSKYLYIKGSGAALSSIDADGFVKMSRKALDIMFTKDYGSDEKNREALVLADLMAAREKGEENKRPSVETMLHHLFVQKYVLHIHPAFVNALTCAIDGESTSKKLFPDSIWIPACKPGYILSKICYDAFEDYFKQNDKHADVLILQNHGIFIAANSVREIDSKCKEIKDTLTKLYPKVDLSENLSVSSSAAELSPIIRMLYRHFSESESAITTFFAPNAIFPYISDKNSFLIFDKPPTPDHIVYCKASPLFLTAEQLQKGEANKIFSDFIKDKGYTPKIIAVQNIGLFACGATFKEASVAREVFLDEIKIIILTSSFGGYLPMSDELTEFIINWEVESYRSKASLSAASEKRLSEKIALVTGSAQGFGKGIAERLAKEGAYVVIADLNEEGAKSVAKEICESYGNGYAIAVGANVSEENSVQAMFEKTVLTYGGLDLYINNAGIVRAGSLDEMDKKSFDLVTSINYTAYFLCAKYASKIMKLQHFVDSDYMSDIIEINSKSGLVGSNKNFAYAGSKFGGIGLTQSFALELAPYKIKVNAICPGNFLDGPLWSDPEKGLFVQYLNAGKVPGAKTIEDVRKFYESKVPLGRGCEAEDVVRAIFYIVEQTYETGQALPVTGGQEMLK